MGGVAEGGREGGFDVRGIRREEIRGKDTFNRRRNLNVRSCMCTLLNQSQSNLSNKKTDTHLFFRPFTNAPGQ